ncbi:MAG: hypothetical protein QOC82_2184 [Frankiaceae bacterium]|jgi:hypothetical protein|nr:hypothetical protein [Frankiaceae bacterium]
MKFSAKVRLGFLALVTAASAFAVVPANADTGDAATITGTGTISPGLTDAGGPQTFSFSGNGGGVVGGVAGQYSCSVNGNDTIGTTTQGAGAFSGTCSTPCGTIGVSGNYTRTGAAVSASGSITSGCIPTRPVTITCVFAPSGTPPIVGFTLVCHIR